MRSFLWQHLLVPIFWFLFEFIGDRPWLLAIIVGLIAILVWRFCIPWLKGFYALFGWQGYALIAAALVSFGIFGAGWRAHRNSVLDPASPEYHGDKPAKKLKPKRVRSVENNAEDTVWYKMTHGIPLN
jgi:hypothetical protein